MNVKGLIGAIGGGVIGLCLWAAVMYGMQIEVGGLALVVGFLVGVGSVMFGGTGDTAAAVAGLVTLCAVLGGKALGTAMLVEHWAYADAYADIEPDVEAFRDVRGERSMKKFMIERGYTHAESTRDISDEEFERFRDRVAPMLEDMGENGWELDEFKEKSEPAREWVEHVKEETPLLESMFHNADHLDVIFLVLGLGAAVQVCRASESMKTGL